MNKEQMVEWLNGILANKECSLQYRIEAAKLLSSLEGWRVNYCRKVHEPRPNVGPR